LSAWSARPPEAGVDAHLLSNGRYGLVVTEKVIIMDGCFYLKPESGVSIAEAD
jgi:hypothetical protein